MSLTEREKEIARECAEELRGDIYAAVNYAGVLEYTDIFLSRVREGQEAIYQCFDDSEGQWFDVSKWIYDQATVPKRIVFTTPPAVPNCSELVEALKKCREWHSGDSWRFSSDKSRAIAWKKQLDAINEALANHAKRIKGEE